MKKYDLVYLKNNSQYRKYGIEKNTHGIIIDIFQNHCQVLFFNPHNLGEATLLYVNKADIDIDKETLPENLKTEIEKNIEKIKSKENFVFTLPKFKLFDKVELVVEKEKYSKLGLHKGEIGFIVDEIVINNSIEIDFPNLNENSKFYGDTFSIDIDDLKIIK